MRELQDILGPEAVLSQPEELITYSYDATWAEGIPDVVVNPTTTEQVAAVLRIADRERIPVVPRGAGTGLAGASVPQGGIVLNLARMNRLREISPEDMVAVVEPGVVNQTLQEALQPYGLMYPPDPASLYMSTIGGNVATNAGGPRCLKYGVTKDYVMGLEVVLPGGQVLRTGGRQIKNVTGYNLTQLFVGSEGTLGVITEITLRLIPAPAARATVMAAYARLEDAAETVNAILSEGILPLTTELMDQACIRAVERKLQMGLPTEAEALMLIAVDGEPEAVHAQIRRVAEVCRRMGADPVEMATTPEEEERLWIARRSVSPALALIKPSRLTEDIVVPRSKIPAMIRRIQAIAREYDVMIPTFGHIGDGNVHPDIMCDRRDPEEMRRVALAAQAVFEATIELGGTLSGEHGIGLLKREFLPKELGPLAIEKMLAIKKVFDPNGIMNPGKVFPKEMEIGE
ncbi:MAG TPA: FAD-binding protein [Caldilineae bacterium]|nr:FAD-binding protein [Caldilineae bacterium]